MREVFGLSHHASGAAAAAEGEEVGEAALALVSASAARATSWSLSTYIARYWRASWAAKEARAPHSDEA